MLTPDSIHIFVSQTRPAHAERERGPRAARVARPHRLGARPRVWGKCRTPTITTVFYHSLTATNVTGAPKGYQRHSLQRQRNGRCTTDQTLPTSLPLQWKGLRHITILTSSRSTPFATLDSLPIGNPHHPIGGCFRQHRDKPGIGAAPPL